MITAKNYAAQAEQSLRKMAENAPMATNFERLCLAKNAEMIKKAVHFTVPDNCELLKANGAGLLYKDLHLPFPIITVEYWYETQKTKVISIAYQLENSILITGAEKYNESTWWEPCPIYIVLTESVKEIGRIKYSHKVIRENYEITEYEINKWADNMGSAILNLLEALSCRNVSTANYQDASPENERRTKAGKLPFYETKMLVIDVNRTSGTKIGNGGSHASPRQHLRRGHIRRLESGNIWVNSCVVGDPTKGMIDKQYSVR